MEKSLSDALVGSAPKVESLLHWDNEGLVFKVGEGRSGERGGERRRRGSKSSLFQRLRSMQEGRQEGRSMQEGRQEGRSTQQEEKADQRRDEDDRVAWLLGLLLYWQYCNSIKLWSCPGGWAEKRERGWGRWGGEISQAESCSSGRGGGTVVQCVKVIFKAYF